MKLIFLLFTLISSLAQTENLQAGLWKSESRFKLNGIPLPSKKEKNCVTEAELKNPKQTVEEALKRNDCVLTSWEMKKNKVSSTVKCKNDDFEASGTIAGNFDRKNYDLDGEATGHHDIIGEGKVKIKLSGIWTGPCKSDSKK